eukprot:GEZU01028022.1.p1 GENE.GEZU01028022.1~~GEZU01028022.1.p1  ORF type:complete len:360 (+),score=112.75 GEZU01028022.1:48-1082(+)
MFPSREILSNIPTSVNEKKKFIVPAVSEPGKVELYSPKYFALCSIGGLLSCGITHTAITPLDLVKCNMQANPKEYPGMISGFRQLVRTGQSLTLGWGPTFLGYSAQGLCKFGFYEYFKYKYASMFSEETAHKYRSVIYCAASASAEFIADVALCPWEAVKVRVQTKPGFARGLVDGLPKIYNAEGMNGLFKGLGPLWARQVPYTIIKFVAFEKVVELIYAALPKPKHLYSKSEQLGVTFAAGYIAGVFCAVVSHPADTMVSKLNNVKTEGGTGAAIKQIYADIGFAGLWRGLMTRIIMIGTLTGLQWFIYDTFKVSVGLPTTGGAPTAKHTVATPAEQAAAKKY